MNFRLLLGDCRERMAEMDAESIDAIVCDPPYDLTSKTRNGSASTFVNNPYGRVRVGTKEFSSRGGFMGKTWDATGVAFAPETWAEALRVVKPGAHLLAFGGTRTFHRLTCAIEDAGFEICDCLSWLYGSGFPKSKNIGNGFGTALKPAWEPIILARKPLTGTVAANVQKHGTGAINVDGCRIGVGDDKTPSPTSRNDSRPWFTSADPNNLGGNDALGRWPANVALDEEAAHMLDAQSGERVSRIGTPRASETPGDGWGMKATGAEYSDSGGASRFFYTAKASRGEREEGVGGVGALRDSGRSRPSKNHHPTVKPVALMRWLVRLVTPQGGTVLDPFMGSGTTGIAVKLEGFNFVGIEKEAEYLAIAERRIANANSYALAEETDEQPSLFKQQELLEGESA